MLLIRWYCTVISHAIRSYESLQRLHIHWSSLLTSIRAFACNLLNDGTIDRSLRAKPFSSCSQLKSLSHFGGMGDVGKTMLQLIILTFVIYHVNSSKRFNIKMMDCDGPKELWSLATSIEFLCPSLVAVSSRVSMCLFGLLPPFFWRLADHPFVPLSSTSISVLVLHPPLSFLIV